MTRRRRARNVSRIGWAVAVAGAAWAFGWRAATDSLAGSLYGVTTLALVAMLILAALPSRARTRSIVPGRVVAIVPTYNEDPAALQATITALLASTVPLAEIHVVDDGSMPPAAPHAQVRWHRHPNAGKRHAQTVVLAELAAARDAGAPRADYILTVDSDSVIGPDAVGHLLQAMSDPGVQAATGLIMVRNLSGLIAAITDLEMQVACLTMRAARSRLGVVAPCSGALSLYRADLVLDNLADYVASGTAGDDRRLTHYALQRGKAVAVNAAVVHTDMPTTLRGVWRQRVRWYRSYWLYALWEVRHLPPLPAAWRIYSLTLAAVTPLALAAAFLLAPLTTGQPAWQGLIYWTGWMYIMAAHYLGRPGLPLRRRIAIWLAGTPLMVAAQLLVIRPAMWQALAQARDRAWSTR
ncbi:glycosyltransferase [Planomonospora sp. ID82291]|uniref:glycosyltransferase family 2 protein n=1 Tax=Planomonospora sp. ID82291 TaxID=2738136 RepID=UPI0018C44CD9|nr:glycosyltransferase family 2 protein [Planomonospora sp. ID82291]MBG0818254.1 glycosyltransferase family 2 protein [Planomonospora sp. ID82291]